MSEYLTATPELIEEFEDRSRNPHGWKLHSREISNLALPDGTYRAARLQRQEVKGQKIIAFVYPWMLSDYFPSSIKATKGISCGPEQSGNDPAAPA